MFYEFLPDVLPRAYSVLCVTPTPSSSPSTTFPTDLPATHFPSSVPTGTNSSSFPLSSTSQPTSSPICHRVSYSSFPADSVILSAVYTFPADLSSFTSLAQSLAAADGGVCATIGQVSSNYQAATKTVVLSVAYLNKDPHSDLTTLRSEFASRLNITNARRLLDVLKSAVCIASICDSSGLFCSPGTLPCAELGSTFTPTSSPVPMMPSTFSPTSSIAAAGASLNESSVASSGTLVGVIIIMVVLLCCLFLVLVLCYRRKGKQVQKIHPMVMHPENICTWVSTGESVVKQRMYDCKTCKSKNSGDVGFCFSCLEHCHKGHDTMERQGSPLEAYCHCGKGSYDQPCSCLQLVKPKQEKAIPIIENVKPATVGPAHENSETAATNLAINPAPLGLDPSKQEALTPMVTEPVLAQESQPPPLRQDKSEQEFMEQAEIERQAIEAALVVEVSKDDRLAQLKLRKQASAAKFARPVTLEPEPDAPPPPLIPTAPEPEIVTAIQEETAPPVVRKLPNAGQFLAIARAKKAQDDAQKLSADQILSAADAEHSEMTRLAEEERKASKDDIKAKLKERKKQAKELKINVAVSPEVNEPEQLSLQSLSVHSSSVNVNLGLGVIKNSKRSYTSSSPNTPHMQEYTETIPVDDEVPQLTAIAEQADQLGVVPSDADAPIMAPPILERLIRKALKKEMFTAEEMQQGRTQLMLLQPSCGLSLQDEHWGPNQLDIGPAVVKLGPTGAAASAGLQIGDVVTAVDGVAVGNALALSAIIAKNRVFSSFF